jgi:hypothetical protein
MVHPFDRIVTDNETEKPSRRSVLKLVAGGVVAVAASKVVAQGMTTMAIGEEGGKPVIVGPVGSQKQMYTYSRDFRTALKTGDVETAASNFKKIETAAKTAKPKGRYKGLVVNYRKRLDAALTSKLKRADADLAAKKLVPSIKAYRAISRVEGFKQQTLAKGKLTEAAKLDGYKDAFSEVQAQELYDTATNAKKNDQLAIYQQVAQDYPKTPTGKKSATQAKELAGRIKRDETAATTLLEKARKAKGTTQVRMLQTIVSKYPETESGKIAAQMLPKKPPVRLPKIGGGGGPVATTMAIGEEG